MPRQGSAAVPCASTALRLPSLGEAHAPPLCLRNTPTGLLLCLRITPASALHQRLYTSALHQQIYTSGYTPATAGVKPLVTAGVKPLV
jgi:hypothetical protein